MFTAEILQAIEEAAPNEKVKLLVEWDVKADLAGVANIPSAADRRAKFTELQQKRSQSFRDWLSHHAEFATSQISGSAVTALEANKKTWADIIKSGNTPLHADDVKLHLNKEIFLDPPIKD